MLRPAGIRIKTKFLALITDYALLDLLLQWKDNNGIAVRCVAI
jgi:hypothetical protein